MKKLLLALGEVLLLLLVIVVVKIALTHFIPGLAGSKALNYVLFVIFAVGSVLTLWHALKNKTA